MKLKIRNFNFNIFLGHPASAPRTIQRSSWLTAGVRNAQWIPCHNSDKIVWQTSMEPKLLIMIVHGQDITELSSCRYVCLFANSTFFAPSLNTSIFALCRNVWISPGESPEESSKFSFAVVAVSNSITASALWNV